MKQSLIYRLLLTAIGLCTIISCRKTSVEPVFTAKINNQNYSFDSSFAWIDTSSASLNHYFVNVGAKDIKGNNLVYLAGDAYSNKNVSGIYNFTDPLPYPLPDNFKSLNGISVILNKGQNKGIFHLSGNDISTLSISKLTGSTIQGDFSIVLHPTFSNGATDSSQYLQMTGQFNIPYHFIP